MSNEEKNCRIENVTAKFLERIPPKGTETAKPVARLLAEMVVRTGWDDRHFKLAGYYGEGDLALYIDGKVAANLSGYNFAYQVRIICDAIEKAGFFD